MKLILPLLFWMCILQPSQAQDHIYSQFFNSPVYLNPALNGQFDGDIRANFIYRNQWSSLSSKLSYMTASVDLNVPAFNGGLGLMVTHSNEGTANLVKNNISGIYSYSVGAENYTLSFGIQGGVTSRSIEYGKLIFSDQIDLNSGYIPGMTTSADLPQFNTRYFFDAGAGTNFIMHNLMIGASFMHINRPDQSFTGVKSALPMRSIVHGSYRMPLSDYDDEDANYLIPSVVFYKQGPAQSISAGLQFKHRGVNAGAWYRTNGKGNADAFVVSLIFDVFINRDNSESVRTGFSHDATASKINYQNTSGTTEGSIGYQRRFSDRVNEQRFESLVKCFQFY